MTLDELVAVELQARDVEETLRLALALVSDCNRMYRIASAQLRREFNRVLFERIMIDEGEVVGTRLAEPFAQLLSLRRFERRSSLETENSDLLLGQSSKKTNLAALMGWLSNSVLRERLTKLKRALVE